MLNYEEILNEIVMMNNTQLFNWLINRKLLKDIEFCSICNETLHLKKCSDGWLNLERRCMNKFCSRYKISISIRCDSCFENITIDAKKFLKILCYWSQGLNQSKIIKFVQVSRPTIGKIRKIFIERIKIYYQRNPIRLGGPGVIVNCDEVMINHKVKSHRGRGPREKVWALCIVDTTSKPSLGFFKIIENRTKNVLLPIIRNVVRYGSVIHTDEWASYRDLGMMEGFEHRTVVHKYQFVCPVTGVHTQHCESFNNKIMLKIKEMKGLNAIGRDLFCNAFLFLDSFKFNSFDKMIELLAYDY